MNRKPKKVGKCAYCSDAIYAHQEVSMSENGGKHIYHRDCYKIWKEEQQLKTE